MAKNAVTDWDATAGNNTDIGGINIAEGCPPSGINNAIREKMAQIAAGMASGNIMGSGYLTKSGAYTVLEADRGKTIDCTASLTLTLTAAATLGAGWLMFVKANGGKVTIDPNASETVDGLATLIVPDGVSALVICDGTNFHTTLISGIGTEAVQTPGSVTLVDFTDIPAWVKKITVMFAGTSFTGTTIPVIQIGDSGGIENTGYLGSGADVVGAAAATATTYFAIGTSTGAANLHHGSVTLTLVNASNNKWVASGSLALSTTGQIYLCAGEKSLSGTLDRIRVTNSAGANFDAGSVSLVYQ